MAGAPPSAVPSTAPGPGAPSSEDEDCEAAARKDAQLHPASSTQLPAPSLDPRLEEERRAVISAAINYGDFRNFGTRLEPSGEEAFVLLSPNVPPRSSFMHFGKRVLVLSEEDCLREMLTAFFEITSLEVTEGAATLKYSYPNGAHLGTLSLRKHGAEWQVTDKRAMRSSSFRRTRLAAFYARIPRPQLPDSDATPEDANRCLQGSELACFRAAVIDHNAGRLEKAVTLYEKACGLHHIEACHNGAMLLVKMLDRRHEGLCRLERLCRVEQIRLSCRMHEKYSDERRLSSPSSGAAEEPSTAE